MTMANEPADENPFDGVFDKERNEPAVQSEPAPDAGQARDERGRFAAKAQEQPAESQQPAPQEQQAQPSEQAPLDQNANRHVPFPELLSERKQRQEKERLLAESEARNKVYEQQIQQYMQQPRQQPQPQRQEQPPDMYADPEGFQQYQQRQFQQQILNATLNLSESSARRHYGAQVVDEAVQAAVRSGVAEQLKFAPDPYAEIVEWHKREKALAKFGTDPDAYEKQLEDKLRQKILGELKAGGAAGQPQTTFPGTLANATATGTQGAHLSPEAAMGSVFASGRDRRNG